MQQQNIAGEENDKSASMTRLYLVRHGQASFGTADYDRLSDGGRRQAALLGAYWRRTSVRFDAVFAGPLRRHAETAREAMARLAPAARPIPLQIVAELEEIDTDRILAAQRKRLLATHPDLSAAYQRRHHDADAYRQVMSRAVRQSLAQGLGQAGGDGVSRFLAQVRRGIERVLAAAGDNRQVVVFTSGGTIAATLQTALDLTPTAAVDVGWQIHNTSVSVFEASDGRLQMISFNATAHLDLEADPGLKTFF